MAWVLLAIGVVPMPILSLGIILLQRKKLRSNKLKSKIGIIYEDIKLMTPWQRSFPFFFCLRRFVAAIIIFWLPKFGAIQIILSVYSNIASMLFIVASKPKPTRFDNRLEIFNEVMILVLSLNLFTFTDFVPDSIQRFNMGYFLLAQNYFSISLNFGASFYTFTISQMLHLRVLKLYWRIFERPQKKKIKKLPENQTELVTQVKSKTAVINSQVKKQVEIQKVEEELFNLASTLDKKTGGNKK